MPQLELPERQTNVAVKCTTVHAPTHLLGWLPLLWSNVLFPGAPPRVEPWRWRPFAVLCVLSSVLLYSSLSFHLFEPDEGRYAQISREMLERGEWIVPTLQGEAYLDKPPLFYWLVMLAYSVFGYHAGVARLIPALAVQASVLICYAFGRRAIGERAAFWAALLLIVSPIFQGVGRLLTLDGVLTFFITLAMLALFRISEPEAQARDDSESLAHASGSKKAWWLIAAIACGLGVLTKGPVALLLVLPPWIVYRWLTRDSVRIAWRSWAAFLGIVAIINLPWYVAVCWQRPEFARYFLWQHNVQRFVEPFDHVRPVWFYVPIALYGLLPIVLWAWPFGRFLTSMQSEESQQRVPALGYYLLCGIWCIAFFSMAGSKLPTYILPAFPPLCLALGCFIAGTHWHRSRLLIGAITAAWLIQLTANCWILPAYAEARSPMANLEGMRERCGDPNTPVVCFSRNVDSVAFHTGRSDLRTFRSKDVAILVEELKKQPRTVVLFGHRNSPETLARHLPKDLRMIDRRPMGLCESAVIVRDE